MHSKLLKYSEILANVFLIGTGAAFAAIPTLALQWWVFTLFLCGHAVWTWYGVVAKEKNLVVLNGSLILLDLYAMAIRF